MDTLTRQLALKARLPRTWPAFFERYGSFNATQIAAIPPLLDGENVLLCAPTASGKTAAVIAPLIERHCPPNRSPGRMRVLYIAPTRALANDIELRLRQPIESLGLVLGVKTSDTAFRATRPPDLLITTPESTDSLLAAYPRLLSDLRAIVIDELHLFEQTPRGDHLRMLLRRIQRIRAYAAAHGDADDSLLQYVALSATVAAPAATAARYFASAQVVEVAGERQLDAEMIALGADSVAHLRTFLASFRARGWRKALVFCNSRAEVEQYAAATRANSPFGSAVYVHYSNIEPQRRREIERQFATDGAAICFSSSTLELGIDIGNIDSVILIGPPGNRSSFIQRIGRGNRRQELTRVACCYRTPLEQLLFAALIAEAPSAESGRAVAPFRPAVAVQQIFSLIKQSPTAALRLAELNELFAGLLSMADLESLIGQISRLGYLQQGRPGEWRAGPRLNKLFDEQQGKHVSLSVYSNVQNDAGMRIPIRDQYTGETVARVDALWLDREALTLEGKSITVEWWDGEALWVHSEHRAAATPLIYRSSRQLLSFDLAQQLPGQLDLPSSHAPFVAAPNGWRWFHWLGDLYGWALLDLLRYRTPANESATPGLCLELPDAPTAIPSWNEAEVTRYLHENYRRYEPLLDLGPFQSLLPVPLRRRAVVEQFGVPDFLAAVARLRPVLASETLGEQLLQLCEP